MKTIFAASLAFTVSLSTLFQAKKPVPFGWQQEPKAFRGVAWGTSEKDAKAALDLGLCSDVTPEPPDATMRRCIFPFKLGSVSVAGYLQFMNDRLVSAFGNFPSEKYQAVRTAVVQEYGPPKTANTPTVTIRVNGPFEHLTWGGRKVGIVLDGEGYFHVLTQEFRAFASRPN